MLPDVLAMMDDDQLAAIEMMLRRVIVENQLDAYKPYPKQADFHGMGAEKRERMLSAGNQCITPWTYVQTGQTTLQSGGMLLSGEQHALSLVDGREEIARTSQWFLRDIAPAFRVVLDSGLWFDCTAEHLVLTSEGWTSLAQLVLRGGGLRCWNKHPSSKASYGKGDHPCGQPPHMGLSSDQEPPHKWLDALGFDPCWTHTDAMERTPARIHSYLYNVRPPTECDLHHFADLFAAFEGQASERLSQHLQCGIQELRQLLLESCTQPQSIVELHRHSVSRLDQKSLRGHHVDLDTLEPQISIPQGEMPFHDAQRLGHSMREALLSEHQEAIFFPYIPHQLVGGSSILALIPIGYQPILDVQVPNSHNYKAAGVYHHNCGKTLAAANEVAMHLTGRYPDWWVGRRYTNGNHWLAGSESGELTRRGVQRYLFGRDPRGDPGTGSIPKDCIMDLSWSRHVNDFIDTAKIKFTDANGFGTVSTISLKSYDQGRGKWQADTVDGIWFDEEPPEDIYLEGLTRTNAAMGAVVVTCTLLKGMTTIAMRFWQELHIYQDAGMVNMTIEDVAHYTAEQKAKIIASYPPHEREARTKGIPSMGSGRVFPVPEDQIVIPPIQIPRHWPRIIGVDFGWDHPAAACWVAWDRDTDTIYLTDEFRLRETSVAMQAPLLAAKGKWIPIAWPHDGLQHDKGSGEQLANQYRNLGANMLPERATFEDGGNGVEAGISEMMERMQTGRWRVFSTCSAWVEEFRMYHRKGGLIVKERDDVISASRYAMMMLRFAITEPKRSTLGTGPNFASRRAGY